MAGPVNGSTRGAFRKRRAPAPRSVPTLRHRGLRRQSGRRGGVKDERLAQLHAVYSLRFDDEQDAIELPSDFQPGPFAAHQPAMLDPTRERYRGAVDQGMLSRQSGDALQPFLPRAEVQFQSAPRLDGLARRLAGQVPRLVLLSTWVLRFVNTRWYFLAADLKSPVSGPPRPEPRRAIVLDRHLDRASIELRGVEAAVGARSLRVLSGRSRRRARSHRAGAGGTPAHSRWPPTKPRPSRCAGR
jgi:hypothetical protein